MTIKALVRAQKQSERVHRELIATGYGGSGSRVDAKAFGPSENYPLPWRYNRSPEGICTIYAGNDERVAAWLPEWAAKPIVDEANEDYDPTPYCNGCGAMRKARCHCGPIADNE